MNESRPNGFPGQQPEQAPQSRVPNSPEGDLHGQGEEAPPAQSGRQSTHVQQHSSPHEQSKPQEKDNLGRTIFDCVVPKVTISPVDIPRLFEGADISKEELEKETQKLEQQWLEHIKTMNRQELKGELSSSERLRESYPKWRKIWQTPEQVQKLEWQLDVIREQLRQ